MVTIGSILSALVAVKGLADYVYKLVTAIMLWYVQNAKQETLKAIADAAALSAHATTEEQRYAASDAWHNALSRPRIS